MSRKTVGITRTFDVFLLLLLLLPELIVLKPRNRSVRLAVTLWCNSSFIFHLIGEYQSWKCRNFTKFVSQILGLSKLILRNNVVCRLSCCMLLSCRLRAVKLWHLNHITIEMWVYRHHNFCWSLTILKYYVIYMSNHHNSIHITYENDLFMH